MPFIHSVQSGVPRYIYSQLEVYERLSPFVPERLRSLFSKILQGSQIKKRHFSTSMEEMVSMTQDKRIEDKFLLWKDTSMEFFINQISELITQADLLPDEIDGICTSTTSGFVTPNIDVLLCERFGFRPDIKRMPIFGLGCSGGITPITRVYEYLKAYPEDAVLICVGDTLCNQFEMPTTASLLVSNAIFADGYGTLLMVGDEHRLASESQLEILYTRSHLFPDCEFAVGQRMTDSGLVTHVDFKLPEIIKSSIAEPMSAVQRDLGIEFNDIKHWMCHVGGPKIAQTITETLGLKNGALEASLETYRNYGNQAGVSVVTAIDHHLRKDNDPGLGFLMGLGPGIHLEYAACQLTPKKATNHAVNTNSASHSISDSVQLVNKMT